MKNSLHSPLLYDELVSLRYTLYSSLFSTLPYGNLGKVENLLNQFIQESELFLQTKESPIDLVNRFLEKLPESERWEILFKFLQTIERKIVFFDALEDAAFPALHKSSDSGTLKTLLQRVREEGLQAEYQQKLMNYGVRIVLTAHPTQFYPDQVLGIIRELTTALREDDLDLTRLLLLQLGRTRFRKTDADHGSPLDSLVSSKQLLFSDPYNMESGSRGYSLDFRPDSISVAS